MKKEKRTMFGIVAVAVVMIFGCFMVGCDNGTNPVGGTSGTNDPPLVISGTLSSVQQFRASVLSTGGNSRAVAPDAATQTFSVELGSDNKTLSGKLKDGSITFELSGQYDAVTKVFSVQAPSSVMIFSIVGKLNASDTIDTSSTRASVKVKENGEWTSIDLVVTPSDQTVDGTVNADMTGVTSIPAYCRGILTDQIMALAEWSFKFTVTKNSITMYDGNNSPQDLTVVEITNANGTPADENGPWNLIIQGKWYREDELVDYTGKFYVSKTFDAKLTSAIGDAPVSDLFWGEGTNTPLSAAISQLSGIKMFVVPYCATTGVIQGDVYPHDGYSPLFIGASATANAKAANTLKAKSDCFVLALK